MNNILVTGARRCGTTFLGNALSLAPNTGYLEEPLNPENGLKSVPNLWYYALGSEDNSKVSQDLGRLINMNCVPYKLSLGDALKGSLIYNASRLDVFREILDRTTNETTSRLIARLLVKNQNFTSYIKCRLQRNLKNVIYKDPLSALSVELLVKNFGFKAVVIVRNPFAFYYSMKKKGWWISSENFTSQSVWFEEKGIHLTSLIDWSNNSYIAKVIDEWVVIYTSLVHYHQAGIIKLLRHEDVALRPNEVIGALYDDLGLSYTKEVDTKLNALTKGDTGKAKYTKDIKRNSQAILSDWKGKLNDEEYDYIHSRTSDLLKTIYKGINF